MSERNVDCANLASPESPEPRALRVATAPAVERWLRFCFEDFVESVEDSERSPTIPFWILAEEPCLQELLPSALECSCDSCGSVCLGFRFLEFGQEHVLIHGGDGNVLQVWKVAIL